MALAIGVDIGGSKVLGGVVDEQGAVIDTELRVTPGDDVNNTEIVIAEVVKVLSGRHEVAAVGIGAAGWVGTDRATVLFAPHLAWRNEPLRDALQDRIGVAVTVENDANAAAWAEYCFGAARGEPVVVAITLGTGIGGGLVLDGEVYRGAYGVGAEFGHMTMVPGGRRCACGNSGCWEMYASGTALAYDAREIAAAAPAAAHRLVEKAAGGELSGPVVTAAARAGDPIAIGIYTASLAAALDPSIFVVGGGVSEAGERLLLEPARQAFSETLTGRGYRPVARIAMAQSGPRAGLVGAADLARRAVGADR